MKELTPRLRDLVSRQDGLATIAQLLDHEVSRAELRWRVGRTWQAVLPRVVLVGPGGMTARRRLIAALLWAGPRAVVAGPTAARWHGIQTAEPRGHVDLVVPATCDSRSVGFASARRSRLEDGDVRTIGALRLSSPARSCVDAALATRSQPTRAAILTESVHREVASLEDLAAWTFRLRPRDAHALQPALAAAASGAWSAPEAELLDLVATSATLPAPWANPTLFDGGGEPLLTPDVWFDEVAMAVLVHSHAYHSQGEDWSATVERDADLVAAGITVLGVTPDRIRRDGGGVLRRLERAHATAADRPRPPVRATPRTH